MKTWPRGLLAGLASVLAATILMTACGGGSARGGDAPTERAQSLAEPLLKLQLASATGGSLLPFTVGQPLRQGDVPAGSALVAADLPELQFVVRNRWPDGSAKFALLSGHAELGAGSWRSIGLSVAPAPVPAPALGLAALKATGLSARVDFGAFGSAGWSGSDWDAPAQTLVAGPQMSAWTYRKPIGSDAHLVAWLEVRAYKGGRVEVLPWIENGYLNVPGGTEKIDTASFTLGGSERFAQPLALLNHQRAVLASGAALTHWFNGADPQLTPRHDTAYFMATRLVPHYRAVTPAGSALYARLPGEYTPLMQGSYSNAMGSSGYHPSIGLLPEWDVAYLSSGADPRAYRAVLVNALSAGRYGIHYRDEKTQRPLAFASHPNLLMRAGSNVSDLGGSSTQQFTPPVTGGLPPLFKMSHHPSMGYMAYLLSGWHYFLEELQLLATANCLTLPNLARQQSQCVFITGIDHGSQVRAVAWALRTMAQAAAATPDDDPLRAQFVQSVQANVEFFHGRYVAQPNNPLGVVEPYGHYPAEADQWHPAPVSSDAWFFGIWQEDFLTASFGYMKDLTLLDASVQPKLDALLAWKYRSVVGRLGAGGEGDFPFPYAAQYTLAVAPTNGADFKTGTGPWYPSWGEVARAMNLPSAAVQVGDALIVGWPTIPSGYWGNLLPALSYALDHGAAGAAQAWTRVVSAANYPTLALNFNDTPVWSVYPRSVPVAYPASGTTTPSAPPPSSLTPEALANLPAGQWLELPNTKIRAVLPLPLRGNPLSIVASRSGAAVDQNRARLLLWGGGTTNYYGNELYALDLPSLSMQRIVEPSERAQDSVEGLCGAALPDHTPRSRATYDGLTFIPELDSFFALAGNVSTCLDGAPRGSGGIWLRDFTTHQWLMKRPNTPLAYEYGVMAVYDPLTRQVLIKSTRDFIAYSPQSDTVTVLNPKLSVDYRLSAALDTKRRKLVMLGNGVQVIDLATHQMTTLATTNTPALATNLQSPGVAYDPVADRIVAWHGGSEVWALDMDTGVWTQVAANAGPSSSGQVNGTFGRWGYVERYNLLVLVNSIDENAWVFRLAHKTDSPATP